MQYTTIFLTLLLSLTFAAPTTNPEKRFPTLTNILKPSSISRYSGFNGAIQPNVFYGEASKSTSNNGHDISTLVTFMNNDLNLPATCQLRFYLDNADNSVIVSGTGIVSIFSSNAPAPAAGSGGWGGPGNQRYEELGRFKVVKGGNGVLLEDFGRKLDSVPCPGRGKSMGFEVVPTGDNDFVGWTKDISGLYMTWV